MTRGEDRHDYGKWGCRPGSDVLKGRWFMYYTRAVLEARASRKKGCRRNENGDLMDETPAMLDAGQREPVT